jgi:hypothetical protein
MADDDVIVMKMITNDNDYNENERNDDGYNDDLC